MDAKTDGNFSPEEDFFLASQTACAGIVLLSKVQTAAPEDIDRTVRHLLRAQQAIGARQTAEDGLLIKNWDDLTPSDFAALMNCGCHTPDYVKTIAGAGTAFQSLSFLDLPLEGSALLEKTARLFSDPLYGRILRVKGFYRDGETWYQMNATAQATHIEEVPETRGAIIVIGSALNENEISRLLTGRLPEHRIL